MSLKPSDFQISPPENGEQFEKICLDLYKAEFGDKTERVGRQGQSQDGVDIHVLDKDIGIQCKKREFNKKITESELKKEVEKAKNFQPALKRFILATTCKRDAKIQEEARLISEEHEKQNLFSVEVHSWDEIKQFLDKHPEVYEDYYPTSQKKSSIISVISAVQSESRHEELNKIRDLIDNNKFKMALKQLESFKKKKWEQLEDKEKYRVLTNMAWARIRMRQEIQAAELLIKAWQFDKKNENANANNALAYLVIGDIKNSKKYIEKTKQLNPLNITAYILDIQIKDKENQSLRDIVSTIPQSIKTKYQIAHILSQIGIRKKQYAEAEKWLNIFYNNRELDKKGWKDIMSEADYADMSLGLILAKQDIFSGRYVPDDLKNKIEEIINIYRKLVTESQYSELKEFNPNWYLHYSLALELKGNLDGAISALEEGIRHFPNDNHFKIELSRLLTKTGDIKQSISILEKLLGLQPLSSKASSNYVNKTLLASSQTDISEESFTLTLILADLYFHNKQSEKAQKLLDKIKKTPSISEDNRLEAEQYWIFRLINLGKIDEAEKTLTPLFEKDRDNIFTLILKSKIEGVKEKTIRMKGEDFKIHRDKKIQYLRKAYDVFNKKNYQEDEQKSLYFESRERLKDIQHLSQELYHSKMYKEAEPLLEEITNKNLNHPEVFKLLHTYFENGKNRPAIELAEALLKKFPHRIESVNTLFLIYESLGNKKKAIKYYEKFLNLNPKNNFIRIELALAYIRSEYILKAKELLKYAFNLNQISVEQMSTLSFAYMKTGDIRKALEIQYRCIKNNPRQLDLQKVYFELFTFLNHPNISDIQNFGKKSEIQEYKQDNLSFLHPEKVGLDCYVRIKDVESSEETGIIIEEDADADEYTPDQEFSRVLLGKKRGDIILFNDTKYQILNITSKYVYKYQEILKEAEKRFASKTFLKSFHIPKEADAKKVVQTLGEKFPDMSKQQEGLNKLFRLYSEGEVTIGSIAKISGKHPIEIIEELIFSKKNKWISAIPEWENNRKTQKLLDTKTNILIDLSSLITIHQLKIEKYIESSNFKIFICQSTIDSLTEYINKSSLHSKDGLLTVGFDKEGNLRKNFVPSNVIKQTLNFYIKVRTWAEDYCQIKPLSEELILSQEERQKKENLFGKEFLDSLLAVDSNFILLCEDALLRRFAELEYSVSGVRLFDLIEYFERQVIIDNNQAVKFKAQLVRFNQTYIPIDHNILLYLLKEAKYSVNDSGFQRGLFFLSISGLPGVVDVVAKFLTEICQVPSLLPYNKQVITKKVLDEASIGRIESPKKIAYQIIQLVQVGTQFLPILQNEIYKYIIEWLKGKIY